MNKLENLMLSQGLANLIIGLETDLIANIAAFLAAGKAEDDTVKWKIKKLAELGKLTSKNAATIASYASSEPELLEMTLQRAANSAIIEMEPGLKRMVQQGLIDRRAKPDMSDNLYNSLKMLRKQAKKDLNLVNTRMLYKAKDTAMMVINKTAELANKQEYIHMLEKATGKAVTGIESRQAAMRQCIREMTEKGIPAFVDKKARNWTPEAYVNMCVRTAVGNVAHETEFSLMDEYGLDLIEVSSHSGARPLCAKDQGKIFNRSGGGGYTTDLNGKKIKFYSWRNSSYGKPAGLLGINCGHQIYPFLPGISLQTYFPYDKEENDAMYKKVCRQRELERKVRASKRECSSLDTLGDKEGFDKAAYTLKQREQQLKSYCEQNGLKYKPDRAATPGYGKSEATKVNASYRKALEDEKKQIRLMEIDNSEESDIIRASQSNKRSENGHYFEEIGEIDPKDGKALMTEVKKFSADTLDSDIEKCLVITKDGKKIMVSGGRYTVDTSLLGNKMKGSINIHNHVVGESQYSFSYEDLKTSIADGSLISMACDEKYLYAMLFDGNDDIDESQVYDKYKEAKLSVEQRRFDGEKISNENDQHEIIKKACELLKIHYRRYKL